MTSVQAGLVTRTPHRIEANPSRVITRLFVPGQEGFEHQESRAAAVLARILALDEGQVRASLDDVVTRFDERHRDLADIFRRHACELADRLDPDRELSETRKLLLGATFTSEYAIEGAALCNPSMVAHPDQAGTAAGSLRFVMSVRGIGEGHRSSIGFRTGVVDAAGGVTIDDPAPFATAGAPKPALLDAAVFRSELARLDDGGEAADFVLQRLGQSFTRADLDQQLAHLQTHLSTRGHAEQTISSIRSIAERTYSVEFSNSTALSERVLWPSTDVEQAGMEDARFVRFIDDGAITFYATYTAYSGSHISQQLLQTTDFKSFTSTPIVGCAAADKGLALFPRRIRGRFAAMSRSDRESNAVAYSDRLSVWSSALPCQSPTRDWEALQLGNCGPPIETDAGWLVLTHGVGPMRTYRIGAILLDLDDPTRILGQLRQPLLSPASDERDGYVPNVVYSCGALVHAGTLVLPYGIADASIGIATVPLPELIAALCPEVQDISSGTTAPMPLFSNLELRP
ncbi:MAG: glycoside hydrolase family 130 protein [Mycobacterium sp.]